MSNASEPCSLETLAVQAMGLTHAPHGDLIPPIHLSSTFERAGDGSYPGGRLYARDQSPAYDAVEALLTALEGGSGALLYPSGMAAATAVLQSLEPGRRLLVPRILYWALRHWMQAFAARWRIDLAWYDNGDLDSLADGLASAPTDLLWIETPANPTWDITDIRAAVDLAHAGQTLVVVDSTVATPVLTRPLELGADLVLHSATKYLNGHSDVIAGVLVTREDSPAWQCIRAARPLAGAILGPMESWLLLRGLRTLHLRVRQSCASAERIARILATDPRVAEVCYPGLPSHPGHAVAARQMRGGFGGMLSIRVAGGESQAWVVAARLRVFKRATSLGGVESLVEHRASIEGPGTPCPPDLLRLSVGIEAVEDLLADLDQALG
ncbi:trans-sulfuration enzyme family protein [Thiobaca trueperi]|uniref:Cystathionine gamma-synthase n=1 Tax=Thiobaca trueperi TaxID=127458 RepID=A0A4R3MVB2_9GAMM|nr:PLP-dependent aspartate aminotransferase family protein [Thiobaca trueperi]TCT19446.1 cystathionine gamma-synthase [Thiobaca trueperi]